MASHSSTLTARERVRRWVTLETTSGVLLLAAAIIALVWANSPLYQSYIDLTKIVVGPEAFHLDLTLGKWAADGLLAVFFFIVGVELKHEIVAGSLRSPKEAGVPIFAAVGGMAVPAIIFAVVIFASGDTAAIDGWAIPTATDIAFAIAVLAIFGRGLPRAIRTFLLTLAVVDDLLAIIIIAVFYTDHLEPLLLLASVGVVAVFGLIVRSRRPYAWLLLPLAFVAWALMHASGVHATIAGVLLGFTVPAMAMHGEAHPRTHHYEHEVRPFSSGIALPLFAFFSAGVSLVAGDGAASAIFQPVVLAIVLGLVLGKLLGVLGATAIVTRLTPLRLPDSIGLRDLLPVGFLTGIGFTVSLLIAELSFTDEALTTGAKLAILIASGIAAILAAAFLRWDAGKLRTRDMNLDDVPDTKTQVIRDARDVSDEDYED